MRRNKKPNRNDPAARAFRMMAVVPEQAKLFKRVLVTSSTISTAVSGFVGVTNLASSANCTSAANWGDYQAIALEFRVVAIEVEVFPFINAYGVTTTPPPIMLAVCAYSSDTLPGNFGETAQGPGAKIKNGLRPFKFAASSQGFPNAKLWNALTGGVTPSDRIFGIVIADPSTNPVSTASTAYFRCVIKYMTEFRSLI